MTETKNEINYKGNDIDVIYTHALIGADFATEKNNDGITVVNALRKELFKKTVLLSRLLNVVELPEDKVMSIEQYNIDNCSVDDFKGRGIKRLKADFELFTAMLDTEINNIVNTENDVIRRINDTISTEITPEKIDALKKQQEELIKNINKRK